MSRVKKVLKNEDGFTLIELLIVIVIIGTLAAIVVPNISNLTGTADKSRAEVELNTLRTEVAAYRAEEGEYPGDGDETDLSSWSDISGNWDTLTYSNTGDDWSDADGTTGTANWSIKLEHNFGDSDEYRVISDQGVSDWTESTSTE